MFNSIYYYKCIYCGTYSFERINLTIRIKNSSCCVNNIFKCNKNI